MWGTDMEVITQEIERALDAGLYYLALVSTLTLPDICAAVESPNGETTGPLYMKWCAAWLEGYPFGPDDFSYSYPKGIGEDLYYLRCGVVHQGRLAHHKSQYSRVLFTIPNTANFISHLGEINDALNLDIVSFCHDMINAASRWYEAKQSDVNVQANFPRLVQYRQQGLAPYIVGIPLIA
jgi:hypothetical protein